MIIDHYREQGAALANSGDRGGAMIELNKAITLAGLAGQPNSPQVGAYARSVAMARGSRGLIWLIKGNEEEAQKDFAECLKLDPSMRTWIEDQIQSSGMQFSLNKIMLQQDKKEANTATSKLAVLSENLAADNIAEMRRLLDAGADVNVRNKYDATPLYMASEYGQTGAVKLLLAANADVNIAERILGTTPLMAASMDGHAEVVKLLLAANANANIALKPIGLTPLIVASMKGHTEVVKLLLAANAGVNIADDKDGTTPLIAASIYGKSDVLKLLLAANANVNTALKTSGMTSLIAASMHGYTEIVKILLDAKANIDATMEMNGEKYTALQIAGSRGHAEIVKILKERIGEQ
jgi:ankyrin repeat protein